MQAFEVQLTYYILCQRFEQIYSLSFKIRNFYIKMQAAIPGLDKNAIGRRLNYLISRNTFITLSTFTKYVS